MKKFWYLALTGFLFLTGCQTVSARVNEPELNETSDPLTEQVPLVEPTEDDQDDLSLVAREEWLRYVRPTSANVNLRQGAGTQYAVVGQAKADSDYYVTGERNGWWQIACQNGFAYLSSQYTSLRMTKSASDETEAVIREGCALIGVPYVYGATRYMDGEGHRLKGFTPSAFDCSSLMQYIFYRGAGVVLDVTTRTQVLQGEKVEKSQLQRGDLLFFTNASRKNKTGIERIGHVALYLGDNYILHTASDYAKIEQLTAERWNNYICARRIL